MDWSATTVLVTGGTGSFGRRFVQHALAELHPRKLIVFSRDELKQHEMRDAFPEGPSSPIRYFVGDVRDRDRLGRALHGVDVVVHAAAMKQVPACEYNPFEAVQTNIIGAKNVIDAAIDAGVTRVMALSTDKAVSPVNLYGATKLVAEKLFVQANVYVGDRPTRFSCVRYGNVIGSRGSVVPRFVQQRASGRVTITDPRMTRFWLTLEQGVRFVVRCTTEMIGGEVFVPRLPSVSLLDVARVLAPGCELDEIGVRSGEKLHEQLISDEEIPRTLERDGLFVIQPKDPWWQRDYQTGSAPVPPDFRYSSDVEGTRTLSEADLLSLLAEWQPR
ncbi:MAG: UDP-N-acetylglucosamine 4,6-dehydratase (inverting) [Vicinamibacterales bacterium]